MYKRFYNLSELPFTLSNDEKFYFESASRAEVLSNLLHVIQRRQGVVMVTGPFGAGKTYLSHLLMSRLGTHCIPIVMQNPPHTGEQLLRAFAQQVGARLTAPNDATAVISDLQRYLLRMNNRGRFVALILDEAQDLPDDTLKQLRQICTWVDGGQRLVQLLLIGQPELRERITQPGWETFRQQLVLSFELTPLTPEETKAYIEYRLDVASRDERLARFQPDAEELIYNTSGGLPRLINLLCDNALLIAFATGTYDIGAGIVQQVVADMSFAAPPPAPEKTSLVEEIVTLPPKETTESFGIEALEEQPAAAEPELEDISPVEPSAAETEPIEEPEIEIVESVQEETPPEPETPPAPKPWEEPPPKMAPVAPIEKGVYEAPAEPMSTFGQPARIIPEAPHGESPRIQLVFDDADESISIPAKPVRLADRPRAPLSTTSHVSRDEAATLRISNTVRLSELIVAHRDRGGKITEEYRALRTSLLASSVDERFCYLVTSSERGEGKTITCLNLAMVMLERPDFKTILVDADLRRSQLAGYLKARSSPGLADLLRGTITLNQAVQPTVYPNLFFIPAGRARPEEIGELLGSPEAEPIVGDLRRLYDYVIFDTPPINLVPDAGMLGLAAGEALMVVRMEKTKRDAVDKAIRLLRAANVDVSGIVLTNYHQYLPTPIY